MVGIGLLGCGRIGKMHAENLTRHARATLSGVYDLNSPAAEQLARKHDVTAFGTADALLRSPEVDAVLIATSTETHADLIELAAEAGKPILCEKPVDLDLARVDRCVERIEELGIPVQIGFNRRFDPGHRAANSALRAGEIGDLHQVILTSRDPGLPPRAYLESSGGLFRDMTIHDFDLARFMLGSEPTEVFAFGNALVDPELGRELDEIDTAMILLRTESGIQCHINNSRSAVYGYDQRVELFGSAGMLLSGNRKPHELRQFGANGSETAEPYQFFFIERYQEAFMAELSAFVEVVENGSPPEVGLHDGRQALALAEAAYKSLTEGRVVRVEEIRGGGSAPADSP